MEHVGILTDARIKRILELTAEEIDGRWHGKGYGGDDHGSTTELFAKIREIEDEWLSDPVEAFTPTFPAEYTPLPWVGGEDGN